MPSILAGSGGAQAGAQSEGCQIVRGTNLLRELSELCAAVVQVSKAKNTRGSKKDNDANSFTD